jgi:hypothetical protein
VTPACLCCRLTAIWRFHRFGELPRPIRAKTLSFLNLKDVMAVRRCRCGAGIFFLLSVFLFDGSVCLLTRCAHVVDLALVLTCSIGMRETSQASVVWQTQLKGEDPTRAFLFAKVHPLAEPTLGAFAAQCCQPCRLPSSPMRRTTMTSWASTGTTRREPSPRKPRPLRTSRSRAL